MSDNNTASTGIGFTSMLLILFITLKLTNVITWSWWWVLSPIWIEAILLVVIIGVLLLIKAIYD